MNKRTMKILSTILMAIVIISVATSAFALKTPGDIKAGDTIQGEDAIVNVGNQIVGILQTVGIVLSVVVLIIIGIKYMMGSAEEKAEYKKTMIPYIVGAALIFTASIFANVIFQFFNGMTGSAS